MKWFLKILILTLLMIAILKSCSPFLGTHNPLIGQQAPDFTLETLSEQQVNMTRFRNGQPAIIFFWATWCPHCRKQLQELTQQRQQIEENGIKIILVDVGESLKKVKSYMDDNKISFDCFLDQSSELASAYEIVGVPTFFLVSQEGTVVAVENFLPDQFEELLLGLTL